MAKVSILLLSLASLFLPVLGKTEPAQAVISIRQYQEVGPSNIHLYLYTLDGKLIRQLTNTPGFDDLSPIFDWSGKSVLFFRQASTRELKAKEGNYILNLSTNKFLRLSSEEAKAQEGHYKPTFQPAEFSWPSDKSYRTDTAEGRGATVCQSPDGKYQLIRKPNPDYSDSNPTDDKGGQIVYFLQTKGDSETLSLDFLPGLLINSLSDNYLELNGNPFVVTSGYAVLFMTRHVDSTEGNSLWAFDLRSKKWIEMSGNAGLLYFAPEHTGVILLHSARYENLGKSGKVVSCGYLEFWDTTLHPVRLGPPTSLFHGAAIYYGAGETLILQDPDYGS
jgi:hypothetical protein